MSNTAFLAADPAAASSRLEALGFPLFLFTENDGLSTYWHDGRDELGHCIEILSDVDMVHSFRSALDRAAAGWDGTEPLRTQLPM